MESVVAALVGAVVGAIIGAGTAFGVAFQQRRWDAPALAQLDRVVRLDQTFQEPGLQAGIEAS